MDELTLTQAAYAGLFADNSKDWNVEKLHFSTSEEMFAAGYCLPLYDINTNLQCWKFRDETLKTIVGAIPIFRNENPDISLARIEDVRAKEWKRK